MGEPEKGSVFPPNSQFQPDWEEAGEVSPELGHPEQQPWAMGRWCLPPLPGPGRLQGARAGSAL